MFVEILEKLLTKTKKCGIILVMMIMEYECLQETKRNKHHHLLIQHETTFFYGFWRLGFKKFFERSP